MQRQQWVNDVNAILNEVLEWFKDIAFFIPGKLGQAARVFWCRRSFSAFGHGSRVGTNSTIVGAKNIRFGNFCEASSNCLFVADGGTLSVGDRVKFNHSVHINASVEGEISIGDDCLIGPGVVMRSASHRFDRLDIPINQQGHASAEISIGRNVWLAANVIVLPGVELGDGCVVAAGSVVTKSYEANSVIAGVPARLLRDRGERND